MAGLARYGSYRKFFLQPKKRFTVNLIRFKVGSRESGTQHKNEWTIGEIAVICNNAEGRGVGGRGVF